MNVQNLEVLTILLFVIQTLVNVFAKITLKAKNVTSVNQVTLIYIPAMSLAVFLAFALAILQFAVLRQVILNIVLKVYSLETLKDGQQKIDLVI